MYTQALKQREYYIETFGMHRFTMIDYYKILGCIALFWFDPVEPVLCGECGKMPLKRFVYGANYSAYKIECTCGNEAASIEVYKSAARTKKEAIKRWNKMNRGTVCDLRKD